MSPRTLTPQTMNPRTMTPRTLTPQVRIDVLDRCTACGACIATCPEHALRRAPRRPAALPQLCTSCFACVEVCPVDAVVIGVTHG